MVHRGDCGSGPYGYWGRGSEYDSASLHNRENMLHFAACVLLGRLGWWLAAEQPPQSTELQRGLFGFVIFGLIGVLWLQAVPLG
jgi:hypothetical protein